MAKKAATASKTTVASRGVAYPFGAQVAPDGIYDASNLPPGIAAPGVGLGKGTRVRIAGGRIVEIIPAGHAPTNVTPPGATSFGGSPTSAATATQQPPPVQPFLNPTQQIDWSNAWAGHMGKLFDIDSALNNLRTNTTYEKANIEHDLARNKSVTIDNMIARGLGRSSISQGELNDLDATATRRKTYLDTTLNAAEMAANGPGGQKEIENAAWSAIQSGFNQMAAQNAIDTPRAPAPATPQVPTGAGKPQPSVGGYTGVNGTWDPRGFWVIQSGSGKIHQYPDGHRVLVK